jgi:ParB family chromosome partitioning protein
MAQHNIGHFERVRALASGARVLVLGGERDGASSQVTFFDVVSHKRVAAATIPAHVYGVTIAGEVAVAACSDGKLRFYKAGTGEALREIEAHQGAATAVVALADGGKVLSAGADGKLRLFTTAGALQSEWSLSSMPLRAAAADPTGEYIAAAGDDGVVRVITLAGGALREMPGHEGSVRALAFTPRDGRIVSGGEDGLIRIWFLAGDIDCEVRGNDDAGHKGTVHGLLFLPKPRVKAGTEDPGDRFVSVGSDGKAKFWRLEDRRKPRTIDVQTGNHAAHALAFAKITKGDQSGLLLVGGDHVSVDQISIDQAGAPGSSIVLGHGFFLLREAFYSNARAAHENAVRELAPLEEPEAINMMIQSLNGGRFPEVQELIAREFGKYRRLKGRPALRTALNSNHASVRFACYEALIQIEGEDSLNPQRSALQSKHGDLRIRAIHDLATRHKSSPLVGGLLAGHMASNIALVRVAALEAYASLFEEGSVEPLLTAFERGTPDLRSEALVRAALGGLLTHPKMAAILTQALDNEDASVRRFAFAIQVLHHPPLAARLESRDQDFQRTVAEVSRLAATIRSGFQARQEGKTPGDAEQNQARLALGKKVAADTTLVETDLAPLLAAMACRTPDTALRGARGLADLGDIRALGALLQLSREADKQIRREAAAALRALEDPRAKKRLAWMLDDADADVRTAAYEAYSKLELDPLELAETALRSSQKDIRVQGLNLLVKQGDKRTDSTTALLGDALEDESAEVRAEAFRTLWSWHSKSPEQALTRALDARFPDLRHKAVQELETLGKDKEKTWAQDRLLAAIQDRDEAVALAAFEALVRLRGKEDSGAPLAALGAVHGKVRAAGARACRHLTVEATRGPLTRQLQDDHAEARAEALGALDKLLPREAGPLYAALQGSFYDLKVQAAELLAERGDDQIIDTMRGFLADNDLKTRLPAALLPELATLRYRASKALATLASPRLLSYFANELLKDGDGAVREQAARGLSLACRKGDERYLLDALGHKDVAVRSWAAEGLAKLGDVRALPVLTGHLRHEHPPVRVGAILSFAALGPEGYGGMLQGLEDAAADVQELVFLIVMARDLRAFRQGDAPDLLTSAISSQRPEIRYAAARALELRGDPERYLHHLIEALLPPKPEKASAMKDWPDEPTQGKLMVALAESIASEQPDVRYAASQALRLRSRPTEYFRQVEKLTRTRTASRPAPADTTPRPATGEEMWGAKGWLRRLFRETEAGVVNDQVPDGEQQRLHWLAFGAYVGLLRQVSEGDEGHRVRRDAIERVVELVQQNAVGLTAALPPLGRALEDPNYLVRRAAFTGLKRLFPEGANEPLVLALGSSSDDIARAALDELAARGEASREAIARALNAGSSEVRKHAFSLLEGLYPRGSLEPLFHALQSDHSDMRLGVLRRLANTPDERVLGALLKALRSEHDDLRMMAAELLVNRKNDAAAEVLGNFLRSEDEGLQERARNALARLGSQAAVAVLAGRLQEEATEALKINLLKALARSRNEAALSPLCQRFSDESEAVRIAAFEGAFSLSKIDSHRRNWPLALQALHAGAQSRAPELRRRAAVELEHGEEVGQATVLRSLFLDRDQETRKAAVESYASRVRKKNAPVEPLEDVLRKGARETLLAAAEGVAERGGAGALRPLLLLTRAGEDHERPRAILALGALGDARALAELEQIASGGTEEAPVEEAMRTAAIEALGKLHDKMLDTEVKKRLFDGLRAGLNDPKVEVQQASLRGLRWIKDERARAAIEATLLERSVRWNVKVTAAEILGELKNTNSEPSLLAALKDSNNNVRSTSYQSLRKLFPQDRVRVDLHALTLDDTDLAEPAARYLADEADPALLLPKLAEQIDEDLVSKLRFGLLRRPALADESLTPLLTHDTVVARSSAAWLLGARTAATGSPELAAALLAAEKKTAACWAKASDDDRLDEVTAWRTILWTLRIRKLSTATARLRELATSDAQKVPESIRVEALGGLQELGSTKEDVSAMEAALRDPSPTVRALAAKGLQRHAPGQALGLLLKVQPQDPISFASASPAPSAESLGSHEGRRLVLARVFLEGGGARFSAMLASAKGQDLLDLIAAAGRSGAAEVLEPLRQIAFDKKKYEVAERKAAYRALRRAQRSANRKQQETRA